LLGAFARPPALAAPFIGLELFATKARASERFKEKQTYAGSAWQV